MFLQPNFEFSSPLKCGQPAPDVLLQVVLNIIHPTIVIRDKSLILVLISIILVTQKIIKLDPVGSTARYEMMKLCTGTV